MEEFLDIYSILELEYGSSIDVIKSKMKTHHKNGIWNDAVYLQILKLISVPEDKDSYDQEYLRVKIGEDFISKLVWRTQRHGFIDYYRQFDIDIDSPAKQVKSKLMRLNMILHPDKPQGNHDKFQVLCDATYILTNESARFYYNIIYKKFYSTFSFLEEDETNSQEEESIQRNKIKIEQRQVFIKNFDSEIKILKEALKHFGRISG